MQNQPSEALLQVQLLRAQLEQIQRVKEFLKNLQPGRKIYIDLGGVMVESNYLEAMEYLEEEEKEIRELLLKLESQINLKQFQVK